MIKKIILFSIFIAVLIFSSPVFAQTGAKPDAVNPGLLPDSPLYFFEKIGENIRTFFTFGKSKAERHVKLAEERMAEIRLLRQKGKTEIADKTDQVYQRHVSKVLLEVKKNGLQESKKDQLLIRLVDKNIDNQKMLVEVYNKAPEKNKQRIKIKLENEKKKYADLIGKLSDKGKTTVIEKLKPDLNDLDKKIKELDIFKNNTLTSQTKYPDKPKIELIKKPNLAKDKPNTTKPELAVKLGNNQAPQTSLAPLGQGGGKPGMNEEGSTQVVNPKGNSGNSCSKLYICKINCGKDIIEKCNGYSANKMYQLLQCQGGCYKYNIFYGCGMEAGCDESCWQSYDSVCSPNKYESCISNCDDDFGDC